MRRTLILALSLVSSLPAAAQERPVSALPELTDDDLSSLLLDEESSIERCATRTDAGAYVASVSARIVPGAAPSTLYHAGIAVSVTSRPRDPEFEGCVRRVVRDALRHASYAVPRAVRAQHTFQITERPTPPPPQPTPPFSESEVQRVLSSQRGTFQRCIELAGVPEQITLRVSVRPDGRLVLTSADLPPGASSHALGCLASQVSYLRVSGRPGRSVTVVHRLGVQSRGY